MAKSHVSNCISPSTLKVLADFREKAMLEIGSVHLMHLTEEDECTVPLGEVYHPKMIVIVGHDSVKDEYYGNVFINSKINKYYATAEVRADHIPISSSQYSFIKIDHNPSYINCAAIKSYSRVRILSENNYLGKISEAEVELIRSKIESSKQVTPKRKKRFGFEDKSR